MRRKVSNLALGDDGFPGQEFREGLIEILEPRLVGRKKYEGVAVKPGRVAPGLPNRRCRPFGSVARLLTVSVIRTEDDQACIKFIGNVSARIRQRVDTVEIA